MFGKKEKLYVRRITSFINALQFIYFWKRLAIIFYFLQVKFNIAAAESPNFMYFIDLSLVIKPLFTKEIIQMEVR